VHIFGKGTPQSPYALVIEMDSPDLQRLHKELKQEYGLRPTFPIYKPHLSITYDIGKVMPGLKRLTSKQKETIENIFSKMIPELPREIKIQSMYVEDLDDM
jgi:hypothetical protein